MPHAIVISYYGIHHYLPLKSLFLLSINSFCKCLFARQQEQSGFYTGGSFQSRQVICFKI